LNISVIILINNLNLDVDTSCSYLLIRSVIHGWLVFLDDHILWEIQVLVISFDHILPCRIFESVSLGRGENTCSLFTIEIWWCWILIDTSLREPASLASQTSLWVRIDLAHYVALISIIIVCIPSIWGGDLLKFPSWSVVIEDALIWCGYSRCIAALIIGIYIPYSSLRHGPSSR
jgi:hypothetical protein